MSQLKGNYGFFDKVLHHSAFKMQKLQIKIAKYETEKNEVKQQNIAINKPVFITSLPRAGTSILLNILANSDHFSYQTYQDMPFAFLPLIWGKFSRKFEKNMVEVERAHQDGLQVNLNSPEAFEEIYYKAFWPQNYQESHIPIWEKAHNLAFNDFICDHIKKLLFRDKLMGNVHRTRYISKNNLNISRVSYITQLFPSATILIPFRQPLQQAISLLIQHKNFTQQHKKDKFTQSYMADIGHFDFGQNLKPINFDNWFYQCKSQPDTLNFWLEYWFHTYRYLESNTAKPCIFFNFDTLCQSPEKSLSHLAQHLQLEPVKLLKSVPMIRKLKTHDIDLKPVNKSLIEKANKLHQQLVKRSIN